MVTEIGAQKGQIISIGDQIKWQDKPRPRVYWYETEGFESEDKDDVEESASSDIGVPASCESVNEPLSALTLSEVEFYPVLIDCLRSEHQLNFMRID